MSAQRLHGLTNTVSFNQSPPLPSISTKRSDETIKKVREYIEEEQEKSLCNRNGFDPLRFIIYKRALDMLIEDMTVYKDLMADIKREYEDCINTIESGSEETMLLKNRVDSLSAIKPTLAGYQQRKTDLTRKLEILNKANAELEGEIKECKEISEAEEKRREEENNQNKKEEKKDDEDTESIDVGVADLRPIPGLAVADWTNFQLLRSALSDIRGKVEEQAESKANNYVLLKEKNVVGELIMKGMLEQDEVTEQLRKLTETEKELVDTFVSINDQLINDRQNHNVAMEIYRNTQGKKMNQDGEEQAENFQVDDDDPWSNKEADVLLEYVGRFQQLFETSYEQAAIHAANCPRFVLRHMKVFNMFREASEGCRSSPTPLLFFVHAMINSSSEKQGKLDKEMSIASVRCILDENRPELMRNWTNTGGYTFCSEIGHMFLEYSKKLSEHRVLCLDIAQRMFLHEKDHAYVCVTLYTLGQYEKLFSYAHDVGKFKIADYVAAISMCKSSELLWMFYHPGSAESFTREFKDITDYHSQSQSRLQYGLPIRMVEGICALLNSGAEDDALRVLEELYKKYLEKKCASKEKMLKPKKKKNRKLTKHEAKLQQQEAAKNEFQTGEFASLDQIPYYELEEPVLENEETAADDVSWSRIANFARDQDRPHLELEIRTALFVKSAILKSVMTIEMDERAQFDYYK